MAGRILSIQNLEIQSQSSIVVHPFNIELDLGQGIIIYGLNNSGKSLICETIFASYNQIKGTIKVCDFSLNPISPTDKANLRRKLGYASQVSQLLPHKTVRVNLLMAINASDKFKDIPSETLILEHLNLFDLSHSLKTEFGALSYSQQKLISFIRAIIHKPKFLVLDGLMEGLDSKYHEIIIEKLEQLVLKDNLSYLITTHSAQKLPFLHAKSFEIIDNKLVSLN
ncbi:MAG: ATP-binding cassette domain-containing protein [Saprospiraceae bacterium]|nr:ATP-binding cassette domain-containing protein [Saprospiraceae bacterium]